MINGTSVTVMFSTSDFNIVKTTVPVEEAGKHPEVNHDGEGHLHLILDLQPLVVWESSQPFTFSNVAPGEHQLTVELTATDHASFGPQVSRQIRFRTVALAPHSGAALPRYAPLAAGLILLAALWVSAGKPLLARCRA